VPQKGSLRQGCLAPKVSAHVGRRCLQRMIYG
jgi:hypothetical protein